MLTRLHKFDMNLSIGMIERNITGQIIKDRKDGFISVIYGPRRVGKTVLLNQLLKSYPNETPLVLNGDTQETRDLMSNTSETNLSKIVEKYTLIAVDEAQRIPNIGLSLKIIIDKYPQKKVFVTGSSSLELSKGIQETLTGRTHKYKLYPLSTEELARDMESFKIPTLLLDQLIYGGYPYVQSLTTGKEKQDYLQSIIEDYLFRDLFELERVENSEVVKKLAVLLAFQIGNEVSLNELAQQLLISVKTVSRYLNLLQKTFVIFELGSFSSNLRTEVSRSKKYYFYDLGIRNALIGQFHSLDVRNDTGGLWENFLAVERIKRNENHGVLALYYFWRDYAKSEIDWVEDSAGTLSAYEFKWRRVDTARTPKSFRDRYKTEAVAVNKDNYLDFVTTGGDHHYVK